jgi:hypothetical protein
MDEDDEEEEDEMTPQDAIDQAAYLAREVQADQNYQFMKENTHTPSPQQQTVSYPPHQEQRPSSTNEQETAQNQFHPQIETEAQTRERIRLIAKLKRKNEKLPVGQRLHVDEDASLSSLRRKCQGTSYENKAKLAVLVLRRITMFVSKLIEGASQKYPEYIADLKGWSENVYLSLDNYDEILYDIYDLYGDNLQANPLVAFAVALGTNAVMFAMTKKIVDNPVGNLMMQNLQKMMTPQQSRASANTPSVHNNPGSAAVPPLPDSAKPTVPISVSSSSDAMESPANPMQDIASMLSGGGMESLFNGMDMNKLLSGMGDMIGAQNSHRSGDVAGDFRGQPLQQQSATVNEIQVKPMTGVTPPQTADVMKFMRQHQDNNQLATVHESKDETQSVSQKPHEQRNTLQLHRPPTASSIRVVPHEPSPPHVNQKLSFTKRESQTR